jgi:hypothetical protein
METLLKVFEQNCRLVVTTVRNNKYDGRPPSRVNRILQYENITDCHTPEQERIQRTKTGNQKRAWLHTTNRKISRSSSSCLVEIHSVEPICILEDCQLGRNM